MLNKLLYSLNLLKFSTDKDNKSNKIKEDKNNFIFLNILIRYT